MGKPGHVIAVSNQKGGSGKSTVTANEAVLFAEKGFKVLCIDTDPQSHASRLLLDPNKPIPTSQTIHSLFEDRIYKGQPPIIHSGKTDNLDVIPGCLDLAVKPQETALLTKAEERVDMFLEQYGDSYELVFIDCPPDLGIYALNAFFTADWVLAPVPPESLALDGIAKLIDRIDMVSDFNPDIKFMGVVTTMLDERMLSHKTWWDETIKTFDTDYLGHIHNASIIKDATDREKTLVEYEKQNRAYSEFLALGKKIAQRIGVDINGKEKRRKNRSRA